ncbi:MAG TPA: hypothetical protein VF809_02195 [Candidatus Saccharimonadales bacterium]
MKRGEQLRRRIRHIKRLIGYEVCLFGGAWMCLTNVRLPAFYARHVGRTPHLLGQTTRYVPLVGLLVGAIAGAVFLGANELFESKAVAILLSIATLLLATSRLDSNNFIALLIKFQSLMIVPSHLIPSVLIAANAFSQLTAASFIFTHPLVQMNAQGEYAPTPKNSLTTKDFAIMVFLGTAPLLLVWNLLFIMLAPLLWVVRAAIGNWFTTKNGGYTNYYLTLTQQVVEVCCYLLIVIGYQHPLIV